MIIFYRRSDCGLGACAGQSIVNSRQQKGLTLLELIVVLLILITLSTVAVRATSGLKDQVRWEQTRDRYEDIKNAIIGDPELVINGQPDINGFVADMGRLPQNIKELLNQNYCDNDYTKDGETECTTGGGNWKTSALSFAGCTDGVSTDKATCEGASEIWYEMDGWNGPYLLSSEASTEEDAYVDGWGNLPADVTVLNYGWSFTPDTDPATNIVMYSLGCASCDSPYDDEYPLASTTPGVGTDDWQLDLNGNGVSVYMEPNYSGSCTVDEYTSPGTCEIVGGTWTGMCTDGSSSNRWMCWGNGETWVHQGCTDLVSLTKTVCESSTVTTPPPPPPSSNHIWLTPCSDDTYSTKDTCEAASQEWACQGPPNPDSKLLCDGVGGTWTYDTQDLDLTITYRDGSGGVSTEVSTATVMENGLNQQVIFNFPGSVVPIGVNNILITKNGTSDIYPPSCAGLDGDVGGNTFDDCQDAGGTLLPNNLCDDITPAECLAGADSAIGTLIRDTQKIPFIPYKTVPTINW